MDKTMHLPRIMLAATKSGSGKTFLTCGLLRLLQTQGKKVQAFKCGPDYIDPMFHERVLQLPSRNLDTYFTGRDRTQLIFQAAAKKSDISVIEGVMGYFDGIGLQDDTASSYELACVTQTPVILVVDAAGMGRSVIPLLKGFMTYGEEHLIRGVILNRISPQLYPRMKQAIEAELPVQVVGYVPKCPEAVWQSRHLGLLLPDEVRDLQAQIDALAGILRESIDLQCLLGLAESAPDPETPDAPEVEPLQGVSAMENRRPVRIAVARDAAFCFYYADNLELLEQNGAELVFFSPLADSNLPAADGMLLGGGYPELYGEVLEKNASMRRQIRQAADSGMPILAECGGFMYLQEKMTDMSGMTWEMCGALHGESTPTKHLVRFGYLELEKTGLRGHEFHYFDSTDNGAADCAVKPGSGRRWNCMVREKGIFAGYPHFYYASDPGFVRDFIRQCADYADTSSEGKKCNRNGQ